MFLRLRRRKFATAVAILILLPIISHFSIPDNVSAEIGGGNESSPPQTMATTAVLSGSSDGDPLPSLPGLDVPSGSASLTFAGPSVSRFSAETWTDITQATLTSDITVEVTFEAQGVRRLRRPGGSCLIHEDTGSIATPIHVQLDTDRADRYAGRLTFPVLLNGHWDFQYSCRYYSLTPLGSISTPIVGTGIFSEESYASVLDVRVDSDAVTLDVAAHGRLGTRTPAVSCLKIGSELRRVSDASLAVASWSFYVSSLRFDRPTSDTAEFAYSCGGFTDVPIDLRDFTSDTAPTDSEKATRASPSSAESDVTPSENTPQPTPDVPNESATGTFIISVLDEGGVSRHDDNSATVSGIRTSGDHSISLDFDAAGGDDLHLPVSSCLRNEDTGAITTEPDLNLTTIEPGRFAGTMTFPVPETGRWSFQYSCDVYSLVPVADVAFDDQASGNAVAATTPQFPSEVTSIIDTFELQRSLRRLADPILECVLRRDTRSPVFHGCLDWHSAAHAVFALNAIYLMSDDEILRAEIEQVFHATLEPGQLRAELSRMREGDYDPTELPYGFAWLLWADILRHEAFDEDDLHPLAQEASTRLHSWILSETNSGRFTNGSYTNASWAAISLHRWYKYFGERNAAAEVTFVVAERVTEAVEDEACDDSTERRFFSPCHMVSFLLTEVAPPRSLAASVSEQFLTEPAYYAGDIRSTHSAGLNFTRAWSLLRLWQSRCDETAYLETARDYFIAHMRQPGRWRDNHNTYGHWIPQYGVFSLFLLDEATAACSSRQ